MKGQGGEADAVPSTLIRNHWCQNTRAPLALGQPDATLLPHAKPGRLQRCQEPQRSDRPQHTCSSGADGRACPCSGKERVASHMARPEGTWQDHGVQPPAPSRKDNRGASDRSKGTSGRCPAEETGPALMRGASPSSKGNRPWTSWAGSATSPTSGLGQVPLLPCQGLSFPRGKGPGSPRPATHRQQRRVPAPPGSPARPRGGNTSRASPPSAGALLPGAESTNPAAPGGAEPKLGGPGQRSRLPPAPSDAAPSLKQGGGRCWWQERGRRQAPAGRAQVLTLLSCHRYKTGQSLPCSSSRRGACSAARTWMEFS